MNIQDETEFIMQTFKNLQLDGEEVRSKIFDECSFENCSFRETQFIACTFKECKFDHCNLSLMKVQAARFLNVSYTHCQLSGVNWSAAAPAMLASKSPINFISCGLNYATFIGMKLKGITIRDCTARDVDFSDADLEKADCRNTDFSNTRFVNTNLAAADFRGAKHYLISPILNKLKKTRFSLPEAIGLLHGLDIVLDEDEM